MWSKGRGDDEQDMMVRLTQDVNPEDCRTQKPIVHVTPKEKGSALKREKEQETSQDKRSERRAQRSEKAM